MAKKKMTLEEKLEEAIVKDAPYEVPDNWINVKLNSIVKFEKGKKPKILIDDFEDKAIPYVTIKYFQTKEADQYTFETETNRLCKEDDILIVWDGARAGLIGTGVKGALGSTLCNIRFDDINKKFMYYYFLSKYDLINSNTKGTGIPHVDPSYLDTLVLSIPPLKEQQRIVDRIESLFEKLDKAKELIEEARDDFEKRKSAVLEKAFRGELTKEWRIKNRTDRCYDVLMHEIKNRNEIYSKGNKKNKPNFMNYGENDILIDKNLPGNWIKCPVGLICDCIVPGRDKPKSFTGDIPWITIPNVISDYINTNSSELKLSDAEIQEVNAKVIPIKSVIMSCVGRFGISAIVDKSCVINQQLHAFLPYEKLINPKFLMYHIRILRTYMESIATSTTIAYVNKSGCNSLPINLPPIEEQKEIVRILDKLLEEESKIEELTVLEEQIELIKKSILAKAFRGQLGTNCEDDENALELLKEILNKE